MNSIDRPSNPPALLNFSAYMIRVFFSANPANAARPLIARGAPILIGSAAAANETRIKVKKIKAEMTNSFCFMGPPFVLSMSLTMPILSMKTREPINR